MVNIIKQELDIEETLKNKITFICDFCNTTPKFIKGNVRTIDKTGSRRPAFEELLQDIKDKKCNTFVVLKLDRLTRSVYDWENILKFLEENNAYLD